MVVPLNYREPGQCHCVVLLYFGETSFHYFIYVLTKGENSSPDVYS